MSRELVFTATFNEAGNIATWVEAVVRERPQADILVIDDNSPDGTGQILATLQERFTTLSVIERKGKLGLASAHRLAIRYALINGYDVLVTMDADSSHQPEQITAVVSGLDRAEFCIGTRYRGGSHQASRFRRLLSLGANRLAMMTLRTGLSEYTTSFRAFSPRAMRTVDGMEITDGGYSFFIECVNGLALSGCTMTEVPIDFLDRAHGVSKIPKSQVFLSARTLAGLATSRRAIRHRSRDAAEHAAPDRECTTCLQPWLVSFEGGHRCLQCAAVTPG